MKRSSPFANFPSLKLRGILRSLGGGGGFGGHPPLWSFESEGWWSRSGSNRRPLECHSIAGRDYNLPETVNPKNVTTYGFHQLGNVSPWLRVFSDKTRTVIDFVRLIRTQEVYLNPLDLQPFFPSVRELSVSSDRGDGNGETVKVPVVQPRKMPGLPERQMASIARRLLPVQN
jgi:hypothetical protein